MGLAQSQEEQEQQQDDIEEEESKKRETETAEEERKKVLEQEPEVLPCHPSASPLSPQLSFGGGSPYMGPAVRVWDPYNMLSPVALSPSHSFASSVNSSVAAAEDPEVSFEVYLIRHAESTMNEKPYLIGGRSPSATLTPNGKRQARALGVFLKSQNVCFQAIYSSPLERAKQTALAVCQELKISEEKVEFSESLTEMSQGQWEDQPRAEIYTPDLLNIMDRTVPDFAAPGGESQRQVEYRMVEFLNSRVLRRIEYPQLRGSGSQNALPHVNSVEDGDDTPVSQWELFARQKQLARRKSGKSRLQFVTTGDEMANGYHSKDAADWRQPQEQTKSITHSVGIFTHGMAIKCLLRGLLGSNPTMTHRLCIDNTSVTVLLYSYKTGWQIQRMNDTSHLRLL